MPFASAYMPPAAIGGVAWAVRLKVATRAAASIGIRIFIFLAIPFVE